jgi:hypothetical protein
MVDRVDHFLQGGRRRLLKMVDGIHHFFSGVRYRLPCSFKSWPTRRRRLLNAPSEIAETMQILIAAFQSDALEAT